MFKVYAGEPSQHTKLHTGHAFLLLFYVACIGGASVGSEFGWLFFQRRPTPTDLKKKTVIIGWKRKSIAIWGKKPGMVD